MKVETLLIAGGGTGGHVLAGIAVADLWVSGQKGRKAIFVGTRGKIEETLVPRAGYPLETLRIGSLNRVSIGRRIKTVVQLPFSLIQSTVILLRVRPRYVLGVGGYASGPVVLMARLLAFLRVVKCGVGVLEQNAIPGMTNRILAKFANIIFTAFPGMENQFPGKRVVLTGNPIRSTMRPMEPASRNPFNIFIFGGSLGALGVNTLVLKALPFLEDLKSQVKFTHQTGENDFERVKEGYSKLGWQARVEKFIFEMPATYAQSSLLICRAGSSTLSEIAAVGRASLLIPLPTASNNHQQKNAETYASAGAAVMLLQKETSGRQLAEVIREFVRHPEKVGEMEKKVTEFFHPHAAEDLVKGFIQYV